MEIIKGKKFSVVFKLVFFDKDVKVEENVNIEVKMNVDELFILEDDFEVLLDNYNIEDVDVYNYNNINYVIFVCDVGMGFSVMGVSMLCNKFKKVGINDIIVINIVIN